MTRPVADGALIADANDCLYVGNAPSWLADDDPDFLAGAVGPPVGGKAGLVQNGRDAAERV